jgi:hypothetical protein
MLTGAERKYVSTQDSTFLTVCMLGESTYVGKLIDERLTTDRVDDVRRNVLSILQRLFPDVRLPVHLEILPCVPGETPALAPSTDEATKAEF